MGIHERFAALRFNDRPIAAPLADNEALELEPGAVTAAYEKKPPHRLADLYPNIAQYRTVPTSRYFGQAEAAREWERLWTKTWLVAGRASDIPNVGDWFRFDLGAESFIIVRSAADKVQAFYNTCKHRGNELVNEDFGHGATSFTCIVHSWRWDLKGRNVRVTDRETFAPEALCGDLNLTPVHAHEWGGFVFINMAENPVSFEEFYGPLLPMLASYRMEEMYVVKDLSIEVPANWKTVVNVFNEGYHAHATHPQIKPSVDDYFIQADFYPNGHNRNLFPVGVVSPRWPDDVSVNEGLAYFLQEAGIDPASYAGDAKGVRRAIQKAKRRASNPFGISYDGFTDNQLTDDWNPSLFPNVTLNMHPEGVLFMRMRPHPTDPERAFYDAMVLSRRLADGVRPPAYMGVEPDVDVTGSTRPARQRTTSEDPRGGDVIDQDVANMVTLQKGMHSRGLGGVIRLSEQEKRIQQFFAEIDLYLNGTKGERA
ncbi:SRPBCC family protein [Acidocella sp. KAb 2-4]|uniref:aromatic ring-hydroxylating oxygenase subunit alpha n=1 Tax=Acidocella sp. KAb 2-4 TaxID=2885158 RepID=UPI001D078D5A|nr:aromatic ring-hydroxylating dioxygenase subunit alpha [Acidocella sp. KAb 2-4]MCB5945553.1 aromatic ring-hydroxylating dioxygenase subunit alpha [Acidocella sp. KAb 2-4]